MVLCPSEMSDTTWTVEHTLIEKDKVYVTHEATKRIRTRSVSSTGWGRQCGQGTPLSVQGNETSCSF